MLPSGSHSVDLTWHVQARWLGWEPQTRLGVGLGPVLFLILLGPAGLAPACCLTLCVLDGFSAFALFISPKKELLCL